MFTLEKRQAIMVEYLTTPSLEDWSMALLSALLTCLHQSASHRFAFYGEDTDPGRMMDTWPHLLPVEDEEIVVDPPNLRQSFVKSMWTSHKSTQKVGCVWRSVCGDRRRERLDTPLSMEAIANHLNALNARTKNLRIKRVLTPARKVTNCWVLSRIVH